MSIFKRFLRQPRLAAGLALIVFSALVISAKTVPTPPQTSEQTFSLADFSPVGNGVADDGPALQSALDALANAGGGTLLIPAGNYRIATPVSKNFSSTPDAKVTIRGVPSSKMPAPVTALGNELAEGLDLTSRIIPATGNTNNTIQISNLHQLLIEHIDFSGSPEAETDALISLYLLDIDQATVRHCEFYGLSSMSGGNVVRAVRSELSIELSVFLGCTANSGDYAPIVENLDWRRFSISNSIFLDYGLREFFGKTGMGAPISWINIGNAAPPTPDSPRREVIVGDTFLDEGGWVGISVLPYRFSSTPTPIDLIYISGLKMNVSNLATTGHLIYDVRNLLIENSHYGWSHNASSAIDINRTENVILDRLTCIDHADRIRTDDQTGRLTVINSIYEILDSLAGTTTVLETSPEQDPVQYVRQQFVTKLSRPPDPAAHFYWSDLLIRCESNNACLNEKRSALTEYLNKQPQANFSLSGAITDENGDPLPGAAINLTGSQSSTAQTDAQGRFRFSGLPTSGFYTVAANKRHYTVANPSQTLVHPAADVNVVFQASLNRHAIAGRLTRLDGTGISGVVVQLETATTTTDANGFYSFPELDAGGSYTVVPASNEFVFTPVNTSFDDLAADRTANFVGRLEPELMVMEGSALALDSVSFTAQPFSLFNSLGFNTDGFIRLMLFAKNVEPVDKSQVSVAARDDKGQTHPIEVEFMGQVPGQSWLKQINVKLPASTLGGKCVQLQLTVAGVKSNDARICIK